MVDITVDAKAMDKLPIDPSTIPDAVKRRAAAVDALYHNGQSNGNGAENQPPLQAELPLNIPAAPAPQPPAASQPSATPAPAAADQSSPNWEHRYLAMQGRYNASQKTIGEMQEQMTQLGNELLLSQQHRQEPQPQQQYAPPPAYLTQDDVNNYGSDLVDFTQRAAAQAVAPQLQEIERQNQELQRRLAVEARRTMDARVEQAVPDYREIDRDPRWHRWLLGVDVLSGRVRQQLLNEAIAAADAPRAISFFRGFRQEETATGHVAPAPESWQAAPPREPAVPLVNYAAPGRARPATGGDTSFPPERPIYSRTQIAQLYAAHRKGAYVGREAEWNRQDADIIAAGREGRIR